MTSTDLDAVEARAAAEGGAVKRAYVRRIFSEIAPSYDLLNHLLSFNIDKRWRTKAIRELEWTRAPDGTYLDLCAGTLDVGTQLTRERGFRGFVLGTDFALPMLQAGEGKAPRTRLTPVNGDALELPYRDRSLDGAIVAFGIRNLADLPAGLREVRRVLKPGARFVILEFSTPRSGWCGAATTPTSTTSFRGSAGSSAGTRPRTRTSRNRSPTSRCRKSSPGRCATRDTSMCAIAT